MLQCGIRGQRSIDWGVDMYPRWGAYMSVRDHMQTPADDAFSTRPRIDNTAATQPKSAKILFFPQLNRSRSDRWRSEALLQKGSSPSHPGARRAPFEGCPGWSTGDVSRLLVATRLQISMAKAAAIRGCPSPARRRGPATLAAIVSLCALPAAPAFAQGPTADTYAGAGGLLTPPPTSAADPRVSNSGHGAATSGAAPQGSAGTAAQTAIGGNVSPHGRHATSRHSRTHASGVAPVRTAPAAPSTPAAQAGPALGGLQLALLILISGLLIAGVGLGIRRLQSERPGATE